MGIFSGLKRRKNYEEPEIIGEVPCMQDGYSIVVRAKDGAMPMQTGQGVQPVFVRQTLITLKTPSEARTQEFIERADMPKNQLLSDGSLVIIAPPGGMDGFDPLYDLMKGAGIIISRQGIMDVIMADQKKHADKIGKPVVPEGRKK